MKILILFLILSTSAFARFIDPMEASPEFSQHETGEHISIDRKIVAVYCINGEGTADPKASEIKYSSSVKCKLGKSPVYFYEAWKEKYSSAEIAKMSLKDLVPTLSPDEKKMYATGIAINSISEKYKDCQKREEDKKILLKCSDRNEGKEEDITLEILTKISEPGFDDKMVSSINTIGENISKSIHEHETLPTVVNKTDDAVETNPTSVQPGPVEVETTVLVGPAQDPTVVTDNKVVTPEKFVIVENQVIIPENKIVTHQEIETVVQPEVDKTVVVVPKVNEEINPTDPDCNEELKKEIAALLENDKKNIIGLQYELTVLKMASIATESKSSTVESLVRKQSKNIAAIDDGVIGKMNAMYKKHGLPEDAAAISSHLKQKSTAASYYAKDKRFFNQDSSAFLLAYQSMNENSVIKDSDVSVLWFMDQVSQKAESKSGKYSANHNLTNLSTRVAQYTSAINPKNALSKSALDEMVRKQNGKLEDEFQELIQGFKSSHPVCFATLFGDGEADMQCNINVVQDAFSQLLAINSQIKSTDLISIDTRLNGGLDKTRFSISKYVDAPEKTSTKRTIANEGPQITPTEEIVPLKIRKAEMINDQRVLQPIPATHTVPKDLKVLQYTDDVN